MRAISASVRANDPQRGDRIALDRAAIWAGLVRKAENAVPFVAAMDECRVLERTANGLVREVVFHGERVRETVVFEPMTRVSFYRDDEQARWVIHNDIEEGADGELLLTFRAELDLGGGSDEDAAADRMHAGYVKAIETTLALSREALG